jgi:hypothetical protein
LPRARWLAGVGSDKTSKRIDVQCNQRAPLRLPLTNVEAAHRMEPHADAHPWTSDP